MSVPSTASTASTASVRYVLLAIVAIAIGGIVLLYRGPGQPFVRGHVGDVAATMLVFAIVSLVRPRAWVAGRALVTMLIATSIEVAQVWFHAESTAGHLVLGSTFDWIDLVAYAVGVGIAVAWDGRGMRGVRGVRDDRAPGTIEKTDRVQQTARS